MQKRNPALARIVAFAALVAAFLVVIVVISSSMGGDSNDRHGHATGAQKTSSHKAKANVPATYVIQNGDTLTSIAHETGVSVHRIEVLNPAIDPQILISGQRLKLK
jgi:LysM repeat protein